MTEFEYNFHRFKILEAIGEGITPPLSIGSYPDETTSSELNLMLKEKLIDVSKDGLYVKAQGGQEFFEFMKKRQGELEKKVEDITKERKTQEEDLKTLQMKVILSKEKPVFQSIGMGLNGESFYIGTKIYEDGIFYDAVVTSDRKIYRNQREKNEIKEDFKLNYRFPLYHDVLDYMWSNTGKYGIYAWCFGNIDKITLKEVFEDVVKLFRWKYWNTNEKIYKHHGLSLISNYFLPIFEMKGRELIYGESGFGKTRLSKIYQLLSFNSTMSMDWSDSSIFRIIESAKPTIIIDNFDTAEDEKKKRIAHIFNTGCYQKQKAVRSEGKSFRPTGFNIFSGMIVNSITNMDDVSENRSNITRTLKTENPEFTKLDENNPIWSEIRDKLHVCALQNYLEVKKTYDELKEDRLVSRELERVTPNLTIAKLIDKKLYKEMIDFYVEDNKRRKIKDLKDDWVYLAVENIIEKLGKDNEIELRVKEITDELAPVLFNEKDPYFDKKKHGLAIVIGSAFKNCVLFPVKISRGYPVYAFTRKNIVQFCRLKDFGEEIVENIKEERLTNPPHSPDHTNPPHPSHSPQSPSLLSLMNGGSGGSGESEGQEGTNNKEVLAMSEEGIYEPEEEDPEDGEEVD